MQKNFAYTYYVLNNQRRKTIATQNKGVNVIILGQILKIWCNSAFFFFLVAKKKKPANKSCKNDLVF